MNAKYIELEYDEALRYFDADADMTDFLNRSPLDEGLDEDEIENFVLIVTLDHVRKSAIWKVGHARHDSAHLGKIDNIGVPEEDDYVGACEKLAEMGESLGLGRYTCEHCDATFEYRLPWQETCEQCGRSICDDHTVHVNPEEEP